MTQIDARSKSIRELLDGIKYSIDYYQREYKWRQKHITELLEDLEAKFLESYEPNHEREQVDNYLPYFLGSIVISHKENGKKFIIDGQQRLTSLTLLLIYLHNLLKNSEHPKVKVDVISNLIFSVKFGRESFNLNVQERTAVLKALYEGSPYDTLREAESVRNIVERYHDIESHFPESLKNRATPYFIDWLTEKVFMVQITAFSDDDAYTIFETMNDRGLSLNQSEMLKGYLLSQITNDEEKAKGNQIWRKRILELIDIGKEEEIDFIKAWLRAKYAETIRDRKKGATPKDFDKVGTEFHKWVRENKEKIGLNSSSDYFNFIDKEYMQFSDYYLLIRKAAEQFYDKLETIYFNAHNNFTLQYPVLLAPLKKGEEREIARKKIRIVGRYLDIMIARRFANFRILSYNALVYTMFNSLIKEIRDKDPEVLVEILLEKLNKMDETFDGVKGLYLHQQNRRHIHYLLARMTYHIEKMCGMATDFVKYVTKDVKKPYEIEHLWADKFERHADEFNSAHEFSQYRNYFGGLILLPRGFNQSLSDDSYSEKVKHYIKDNLLAQSLNSQCYEKNPSFLNYIREKGLPFKPYPEFKKSDLEERQDLYQKLCEEIWSPNRLRDELENDV